MDTGRIVLGPQRTSVGYKIVVGEAKTEAGDERIVWLDGDALAALKVWRLQQKKEKLAWGADYHNEGYVFTREDGKSLHPDRVTKVVKRTLVRHGLTKSKLHDLRHFRASALISSGVEIAKISKIMGRKNISVTNDLYGNLFDEAGRAASEQAQGIVPRKKRRSA
jgi:integrase